MISSFLCLPFTEFIRSYTLGILILCLSLCFAFSSSELPSFFSLLLASSFRSSSNCSSFSCFFFLLIFMCCFFSLPLASFVFCFLFLSPSVTFLSSCSICVSPILNDGNGSSSLVFFTCMSKENH
ncbi:hypothetical protein MtrunA17_Chr7g0230321 [Medicago truncatula]|uniref:Uncharacterized protein n=1 Tax=Medicago truncatula TaxID=3880 RepID=A0A396GY08_MEDTR|nr:hypothetical protein MtrunA17_Chr7g0230321 [Medicago truncatula]